ncbi:MAG TPA: nickel pincer cofactor biosynthesis protein LarC [Terracidiphilus sp.]
MDCFSGISGDMLLGALVDAGVPLETLAEAATALNVGARLEANKVTRAGIAATKVDVLTDEHDHGHTHDHGDGHTHTHPAHRHLSAILKIIDAAPLAERVKERSKRAFQQLGEAEAAIHAIPVEKVHFHEVGAVDTIVDIVCTAMGCELLGVEKWVASPLNVGSGTVECAHGTLPVPAPATLALLGDAPVYAAGPPMERVTPTGAAILRMLEVEFGAIPAMRVQARGYGAGGRDSAGQPNVVRLVVGDSADESSVESIAIIETVIDDSSPQLLAYVSELLLEAGAWDVIRTAVQMKKGRSGVQLQVLCSPEKVEALRELIFRETTTIGLHWRIENKIALRREWIDVKTEWGPVRIKVARDASGAVTNASPEFEDCRALAAAHTVPLKQVMQAALCAYAEQEKP